MSVKAGNKVKMTKAATALASDVNTTQFTNIAAK